MKHILTILILVLLLKSLPACKKFVEIPPPSTQLVGPSVYTTDPTAAAAITGIYQTMINGGNPISGGTSGISALLGLSADEFSLYPTQQNVLKEAYANSLTSNTAYRFWNDLYKCVYQANAAIEGLSSSTNVTFSLKQQLIGECKFIRAFCYFYLINIYGDVPLASTTNYQVNGLIGRSEKINVYDLIISDLKEAQVLLSDSYRGPTGAVVTARVRPNKNVATAMLSRVFLYQQKWQDAEFQATAVINNTSYKLLTDLSKVFLAANNTEAIWQLESPNNGFNAPDGTTLLAGYTATNGPTASNPFLLSDSLYAKFESGDLRKANWTISRTIGTKTYRFPYKYRLSQKTTVPPVEYPVVIRLSEIYLIRAEARAQQGNISGAQDDLNKIRIRAGLLNTAANTQTDLLSTIYNERRFELFTEYGHRWLDLKRTGNADAVMSLFTPLKGGAWQTTDQLYPISLAELQANQNLIQNPGYQ